MSLLINKTIRSGGPFNYWLIVAFAAYGMLLLNIWG